MKYPETWGEPEGVAETIFISQRKVTYRIEIQAWKNLLMHGKKDIPMQKHAFTLVKIRWYDPDGKALFAKPLWLIVMGKRRTEFSLLDIYQSYLQRYDLEHFFGFGKQKLLLDKFQTPNDKHEENWWRLVALAYLQLLAAKDLVSQLPRPWERYLPSVLNKLITPAAAQRDMSRIIRQIGTPSPVDPPSGCRFHTRCPIAQPMCSESQPELRELRPGHFAACFSQTHNLLAVFPNPPFKGQ